MSNRGDREFLEDIQEAISRIFQYTEKHTLESFMEDEKTKDAVMRNLEIIGEAVKNLSAELTQNHPDVEWSKIAGLRDRLIHFYFGVNLDLVWDVVRNQLPDLQKKIREISKTTT